ncbi:MAG TPA: FkbM family methyltransferase, partial [Planctomycetota bacterium]|nr:FkbM family methyltransferase [Planctomycetota bacterium]
MASLGQYLRGMRRLAFSALRGDKDGAAKERRLMAFRLLQGEADQITFTRAGIKWTVDIDGGVVPKKLFMRANAFEPLRKGLIAWLRGNGHITEKRRTLIDIGANIGTPSVQLARETGLDVLAIEPVPANFELLQKNVAQNGLEGQVRCVRAAVSLRAASVKMAVPKERATCEVLEDGRQPGFGALTADIPVIEVPSLRLETILTEQEIQP